MLHSLPNSLAQSQYAAKDERILELVNKLRSFGVSSKIDLPTIVFCGNQSAGKSSLLEAISEIQLPKADGTCTRCPMELRLTKVGKSVPWMCQVKIRWEYENQLGTRCATVLEDAFGDVLTNASYVEERVRRAQKAVLNPSMDSSEILNMPTIDLLKNEVRFSKNVVCIDVSGEKCPNLSLMDLPGIIRHTEDGDDHLVRLIAETVDNYISKPNAIIIATITCKDDLENQEIVKKARDYDPEGIRTLGVLTKPDMIEENCHEKFFNVICGLSHPLKLGYYVVRNLTQAELAKNETNARHLEAAFFKSDLWNMMPQERLGVPNLTKQLSNLLITAIKRQLPGIKNEVNQKSRMVDECLRKIHPAPSAHPRVEASKLIYEFIERVKKSVEVKDNRMELWLNIQPHILGFRHDIRKTRPRFLNDETKKEFDIDFERMFGEGKLDQKADSESKIINRAEIMELAERYQGRQLRGIMPYQALCELLERCQNTWKEPARFCLTNIAEEFQNYLEEETKAVFSAYPYLGGEILTIVNRLHNKLLISAKDVLETIIIPMECSLPPYTWNTNYLVANRDEFKRRATKDLCGSDSTLELIAMLSAYFKVAYQRFSDNIPLAIDLIFLHKFKENLHETLMEELGLVNQRDGVNIEELMQEDKEIENERTGLLAQRECYLKALNELVKF